MSSVIAYDKKITNLIAGLNKTGHVSHRSYKKRSVTLHHNAGRLTHQGVLNVWKVRPASAHFNVDRAGTVAQYVKVNEYAWAVGNVRGNQETISIEMANSAVGGNWPVAETTWKEAARLSGWLFAKVIGERPTKNNLHYHHHWKKTSCAGPYMDSVYGRVLAEAQRSYDHFKGVSTKPAPKPTPATGTRPPAKPQPNFSRKTVSEIVDEVISGKWGSGDDRRKRLAAAGYNPKTIQNEVNRRLLPNQKKTNAQIVQEVLAGKWGNGPERRRRLTAAGYNYNTIQGIINRIR